MFHSSFVNQHHLQSSNEPLNSVNVQMANCSLITNQTSNRNNIGAGSRVVLNYPYAINQPLFVNYYPGAIVQAQSPAIYYFLPPELNVYRNQFVLVNPALATAAATVNRQVSFGNVQIPNQNSVVQNVGLNEFMTVNRALYERYNISFNDTL